MDYTVVWSEEVLDDIDALADYIARDSVFYAQQVVDAIAPLKELSGLAQPITRAGLPQDIANAVCFLASDVSDFITGHARVVDGGMTLGAWRHPDLGPSFIETIGESLGISDIKAVDLVYHADA